MQLLYANIFAIFKISDNKNMCLCISNEGFPLKCLRCYLGRHRVRCDIDSDQMIIHHRLCDRQLTGSRLIAAAISTCSGTDLMGLMYNPSIDRSLRTGVIDMVPVKQQGRQCDRRVEIKDKLYCVCQHAFKRRKHDTVWHMWKLVPHTLHSAH